MKIKSLKNSTITIRYDGENLDEHQMDVADLAPALLGLSEIYKIANAKFNGDRASIKVLISTDVEHQCFQFDIQVVQSIWDQARTLLVDTDIATAKELGEWIGLIGSSGGSVYGLFRFLKWKRERNLDVSELKVESGPHITTITVAGDNASIAVHSQALELSKNQDALKNVQRVVKPITKDGCDSVEFEYSGKVETLHKEDAESIIGETTVVEREILDDPQIMNAWVTVYSPVYDSSAKSWRFRFGESHFYMDISETNISGKAIDRGGAMADDAYYVKLQMSQEHTGNGKIKNHYKILEVLEFKAAKISRQENMFDGEPWNSSEDEKD